MLDREKLDALLDREYRDEYLDSFVTTYIAYQVSALREKFGLSQSEFAAKIGKKQSFVSRLEDTENHGVTIRTLLDIAKANDVALIVKFADYQEMSSLPLNQEAMEPDTIMETEKKYSGSLYKQISVANTTAVFQTQDAAINAARALVLGHKSEAKKALEEAAWWTNRINPSQNTELFEEGHRIIDSSMQTPPMLKLLPPTSRSHS